MNFYRSKNYQKKRIAHWNNVVFMGENQYPGSQIYLDFLLKIYQQIIPTGKRVLEVGCGQGDLLANLAPVYGLGIDFSWQMVRMAKRKHPECHFICGDLHEVQLKSAFDIIILSDVLNDVWDIQKVLENLKGVCHSKTLVVVNFVSRVWELPLKLSRWLGLARPSLAQNWLTPYDVRSLFELTGFSNMSHWREILLPLRVPLLSNFLNNTLAHVFPIHYLNLSNFMIFKFFKEKPLKEIDHKKVSVIVPIRNESGNIPALIERIPFMGLATELIMVEGHSTDHSASVIRAEIEGRPDLDSRLIKQPETGKADAVFYGLDHASGDALMLLDGDLSFEPEMLQRFYQALVEKKGDFINGVRFVYPIEDEAMPFINMLGNKIFGWIFSGLLGCPIRDTLCGTKVLMKQDYIKIRDVLSDVIKKDPFGDFSLLLGAARLKLDICEIPIRYHKRLYGKSKTKTWQHGLLLVRVLIMSIFHPFER